MIRRLSFGVSVSCLVFLVVGNAWGVVQYSVTDLGTLGGFNSVAFGINANGQVAGKADTSSGYSHAFLYSSGKMTDLGTLPGYSSSFAQGINDGGQVVGRADTSSGTHHAFLYSTGTMTDLNNLIATSSGWNLEYAYAINDPGQIVGYGTIGGNTDVFLLTPIPEPSTFALLGIGVISLLGWAWRRRRLCLVMASLLAIATLTPGIARAETITFTQTGTGSGMIGTTPLVNAHFIITAFSDTDDRIQVSSGIYSEDHTLATIAIDGIGNCQFITATRTFVNQKSGQIGFSRAGASGYDLFSNLNSPAFATWDMLSSIGPITGTANLKQWNWPYSPVETSGGTLLFNDGSCSCTFQATVGAVPEPSTSILLAIAAISFLAYRRRWAA